MRSSPLSHARASHRLRTLATALLTVAALGACTVKLVGDYDRTSEDALLKAYGQMVTLFDEIGEKPPADRAYAAFARQYTEITQIVKTQVLREASRPLNKESYEILATIDTVFAGYRKRHREKGEYPDVLLQRHQTNVARMFQAALKAERVKKEEGDQ